MTTIQTAFASLKSEMTAIRSTVNSVKSSEIGGKRTKVQLANAPGVVDFMGAESLQTLALFASFLGYDNRKTATLIMAGDWNTFSKYFA